MEYLAYRVAVAVVVSPVGVLFLWSLALHTVHSKDLLVCHDLWSDMYGQACVVVRAPFFSLLSFGRVQEYQPGQLGRRCPVENRLVLERRQRTNCGQLRVADERKVGQQTGVKKTGPGPARLARNAFDRVWREKAYWVRKGGNPLVGNEKLNRNLTKGSEKKEAQRRIQVRVAWFFCSLLTIRFYQLFFFDYFSCPTSSLWVPTAK